MLSLKGIKKTYYLKKASPVEALKNINLDFQDKGMVFILGKSGSGKSTLLNVIGGLDRPDKGSIDIYGKSSVDFSQSDFDSYRNTYVGFIFQEYNILEEFTVGANIALAMELQGKKADTQSLDRILEEVDLSGYANRKPNELSGGQMQRVAIARALIKNPEIILADEPTGALDSNTGKQVFETLKKLSKEKLVIIISHDRDFAERYGDRVIELADGIVISDITKKTTDEKPKEEGLTIFDDKVIYIKQGYQLTNKDLELINTYLKNNTNNETIISIDEKANEQVMKIKGFKKEGSREVFEQTDLNNLDIKQYDKNKFKLLKSKLPFKNSLKMAFSSLKTKPVRLFFTILLSTVAFTLFGLANTFSSYDKLDATVNSIQDYNIDYLTVDKSVKITDEYDFTYDEKVNSTKEDIEFLEKEYKEINFKPLFASDSSLFQGTNNSFSEYLNDIEAISNEELYTSSFYTNTVYGYMNINEEDLKSFEFDIVGKLPKEKNEVALTEYAYLHFEKCGYVDREKDITIETISKKEDLIGQSIKMKVEGELKEFVITAIVDTKFDTTRYDVLKKPMNITGSDLSYYLRESEFYMVLENSYHAIAFVSEELINETYFKEDLIRLGNMGENESFLLDNEGDEYSYSFKSSYGKYLLSSDKAIAGNMFFVEENKDSLEDNEILFSELDFKALFNEYDGLEKINDSFSKKALEIIENYSKEKISEYTPSNDENDYLEYLLNNLDKENEYGKNAKDIINESLNEIILFVAKDTNLKNHYSKPGYAKDIYNINMNYTEVEFAGYYISEGFSYYYGDSKINIVTDEMYIDDMYVDDIKNEKTEVDYYYNEVSYTTQKQTIIATLEFIEKTNIKGIGSIKAFVAKMPSNKGDIRQVVEAFYDDDDKKINYDIQNEVIFTVNNIHEIISVFAKIFIGAGIFFAIFASLLLMNFIATSISRKKREIGILRAVGARGRDVFGIFFKESIIIAIINWLIAVVFTAFLVFLLNNIFENEFQLLITVLNFGIIQIFTIMIISMFVAFLSSFLPVIRISRKKPIDAIRNH